MSAAAALSVAAVVSSPFNPYPAQDLTQKSVGTSLSTLVCNMLPSVNATNIDTLKQDPKFVNEIAKYTCYLNRGIFVLQKPKYKGFTYSCNDFPADWCHDPTTAPAPRRFLIIGMGTRGTAVFERLVAWYRVMPNAPPLEVHVVDPSPRLGEGVHASDQPPYLLLNHEAAVGTMFGDDSYDERVSGPIVRGPNTYEWAAARGYRHDPLTATLSNGSGGGVPLVTPGSFLPRSVQGDYQRWFYEEQKGRLPAGMTVIEHVATAVDLWRDPRDCGGGAVYFTRLDDGTLLSELFAVFIVTGHTTPRAAPRESRDIGNAYAPPHARRLVDMSSIPPNAIVAVEGLGLGLHDVLAELMVGRGGRYVPDERGKLRYVPSGKEPRVVAHSRSGLPYLAKPVPDAGGSGAAFGARFLTRGCIADLRATRERRTGSRQLDFAEDVMPVLTLEMEQIFYRAALLRAGLAPLAEGWADRFAAQARDPSWRAALIREACDAANVSAGGRFESPFGATPGVAAQQVIEADLAEARLGTMSPFKAVARKLYWLAAVLPTLRDVVQHRGLTPASQERDWPPFLRTVLRIAQGPPLQRNEELLALMDAGLLSIAGPSPRVVLRGAAVPPAPVAAPAGGEVHADVLVAARVGEFDARDTSSPLIRNMLGRGVVRLFDNGGVSPGGLDIAQRRGSGSHNHAVDATGVPQSRLFVLGIGTSPGASSFVTSTPKVGGGGGLLTEAGAAARAALLSTFSFTCDGSGVIASKDCKWGSVDLKKASGATCAAPLLGKARVE